MHLWKKKVRVGLFLLAEKALRPALQRRHRHQVAQGHGQRQEHGRQGGVPPRDVQYGVRQERPHRPGLPRIRAEGRCGLRGQVEADAALKVYTMGCVAVVHMVGVSSFLVHGTKSVFYVKITIMSHPVSKGCEFLFNASQHYKHTKNNSTNVILAHLTVTETGRGAWQQCLVYAVLPLPARNGFGELMYSTTRRNLIVF